MDADLQKMRIAMASLRDVHNDPRNNPENRNSVTVHNPQSAKLRVAYDQAREKLLKVADFYDTMVRDLTKKSHAIVALDSNAQDGNEPNAIIAECFTDCGQIVDLLSKFASAMSEGNYKEFVHHDGGEHKGELKRAFTSRIDMSWRETLFGTTEKKIATGMAAVGGGYCLYAEYLTAAGANCGRSAVITGGRLAAMSVGGYLLFSVGAGYLVYTYVKRDSQGVLMDNAPSENLAKNVGANVHTAIDTALILSVLNALMLGQLNSQDQEKKNYHHYAVLQVRDLYLGPPAEPTTPPQLTPDEKNRVQAHYRMMSRVFHPDKNDSACALKAQEMLNSAHDFFFPIVRGGMPD